MNARQVIDALSRAHPLGDEWFFTREFEHLDAYAVRLFTGRGRHSYRRVAYEVKVSWSDFTSELKRPTKRANAIALSHQFYFAMPHELAIKALDRVIVDAPDCGLVAVWPEKAPSAGRSICEGAAWSPQLQVLRHGPLTEARPWTMREITNLMRRQNGEEPDALRRRAAEARDLAARRLEEVERLEERLKAAKGALLASLGHTVEQGGVWDGPFYVKGGRGGHETRRAVVTQVAEDRFGLHGGEPYVTARALGPDGNPMEGWPNMWSGDASDFLAAFRPVEVAASRRSS